MGVALGMLWSLIGPVVIPFVMIIILAKLILPHAIWSLLAL